MTYLALNDLKRVDILVQPRSNFRYHIDRCQRDLQVNIQQCLVNKCANNKFGKGVHITNLDSQKKNEIKNPEFQVKSPRGK